MSDIEAKACLDVPQVTLSCMFLCFIHVIYFTKGGAVARVLPVGGSIHTTKVDICTLHSAMPGLLYSAGD